MRQSADEIEARLREIEAEVAGLGPALQGTIKTNRNRRVRKDGSVYVSPEHYTFVYRGEDGEERWKRVRPGHLAEVRRMKKAGDAYRRLAREHARLTTALAVASLEKKTPRAQAAAPGPQGDRGRHPGSGARAPRRGRHPGGPAVP